MDASIEIQIPEEIKVVLLNLSGGADSSLLFYLVCDYIRLNNRKDIKIIARHFLDLENAPHTKSIVENIISNFKNHFNELDINLLIVNHYKSKDLNNKVNYLRTHLFEVVRSTEHALMNFSGTTANPPKEIQESLGVYEYRDVNRDKDVTKDSFYIVDKEKNFHSKVIPGKTILISKPFNYIDKKIIADYYNKIPFLKYNIFHLTSSCVSTNVVKNKLWTSPCKECWWCKEKFWAFGKYDYERLE